MYKDNTDGIPQDQEEILQIQVVVNNGKFEISYKDDLLNILNMKEKDFEMLSNSLSTILDLQTIESGTDIVSLYVVNTSIHTDDEELKVNQEIKSRANSKYFSVSQCKEINSILLKYVFLKMGVDQKSLDEYIPQ